MKKNILILLTIITLLNNKTFAAPSGETTVKPTPEEGFDTGILARCIKPDGTIYNLENVNNPVFNNKIHNAKRLHQDNNKSILNTNNLLEWTIDGCKGSGAELDEFPDPNDLQSFGTGAIKIANLDLIRSVKSKKKAHRFLFVYTTAPDGTPSKYYHADTKTYAILGLDPIGKMNDNTLRDVSGLRITSGLFHAEKIAQNIQEIAGDGLTKVDPNVLKAQFDGIQKLGTLYTENITNAKNWLVGLKGIAKYEELSTQAQTIDAFLKSASVGSATIDKTKLQDIDKMNIAFSAMVNKLRLSKDSIRVLFNQMDSIARAIPGTEPANLAERLKDPKKYTIVSRLISDALGDDKNAINIFYALDDWVAKSQYFIERINQLKGVKGDFLPALNTKISTIAQTVDKVKDERTKFEKSLKKSIAAGKGDVDNAVHVMYDKLRQDIADLGKKNGALQTSINSVKNVKDEKFIASLAAEVARLTQINPDIKALLDYGTNQLPQAMSDAYNKATNKTNKPVTDVIADSTTHIAQLEAALKPTIDQIQAGKDANQAYAAARGQIMSALDFLTGDKAKLDKLATTVTDPQLKNAIATAQSNIDAANIRATQVAQAVAGSAISNHIAQAEAIKTSINVATGAFKKAYNDYIAAKRTGTPSTTPVMQEYDNVYKAMQSLVPLLKTDLASIVPTDPRKAAITTYVGPKTLAYSLAYYVQTAANLLIPQGMSVQVPA
jgi:hypothetical protein